MYLYSFYRNMYIMYVHYLTNYIQAVPGVPIYIHVQFYRETCISRWCYVLSSTSNVYIYFIFADVLPCL